MTAINPTMPTSVAMGDEDREAGAHCGVVMAVALVVAVLVFTAGYILGAL